MIYNLLSHLTDCILGSYVYWRYVSEFSFERSVSLWFVGAFDRLYPQKVRRGLQPCLGEVLR